MPVGAEVIAARSGMVLDMRSDSPDDGRGHGQHNYLMIRHDDGTVAFYAHLMQDGLVVGLGDRVETGELIAYAGNSGQTNGPHLHFGVYASWPPREGYDAPVVFRNAAGQLDLLGGLATDRLYEALPLDTPASSPEARPPSQYPGASLAGLSLPDANLWGYEFPGADLVGADLTGAILTGADFTGATMAGADLTFARLQYARFVDADLSGATLARTDLSSADMRGADLSRADLSHSYAAAADLRGADLTGAVLDGTRLLGIVWDERTSWPAGFIPPPQP
jgi:uncharacterized protein YjbI with pentapeptide repeats